MRRGERATERTAHPAVSLPGVKILIGKISAHCPECYGEEWRSVNGSERPDVIDDVVCLSCGHQVMCGDLVLQLPIDQNGTLPRLN